MWEGQGEGGQPAVKSVVCPYSVRAPLHREQQLTPPTPGLLAGVSSLCAQAGAGSNQSRGVLPTPDALTPWAGI